MGKGGRPRNPCGTYAAWRRHRRLKEEPCHACQMAAKRYGRMRYEQRANLKPSDQPSKRDPIVVDLPTGWRQKAACAESTLDWFPSEDEDDKIADCAAVCSGCPVRNDCLTSALAETTGFYDEVGVRGGLTPSERKNLRRMLKVSA